VYGWREAVREAGAQMVTVPRPADGNWTRATLEALDERVAVAALPHCHWTDGALVELEVIGERCREIGATLVVDLTQSAGALPLDVRTVRPDFLVAATYKWLLGPYTLGFLYVAPRWQQGRPLEHNWIARAQSEDFARLVNYQDSFQPGAQRFDMGERSNFQLLPMALAALRRIREWGATQIAETLAARTKSIAQHASALGLEVAPSHLRAGHFLGLRFPQGVPDGLLDHLRARQVYVSVRGDSMRVTPHLYNTDEDVERLLNALANAV
jgi:selenocysteine lyase/cysteine desulfurase